MRKVASELNFGIIISKEASFDIEIVAIAINPIINKVIWLQKIHCM